jgi:hypothetical protein
VRAERSLCDQTAASASLMVSVKFILASLYQRWSAFDVRSARHDCGRAD